MHGWGSLLEGHWQKVRMRAPRQSRSRQKRTYQECLAPRDIRETVPQLVNWHVKSVLADVSIICMLRICTHIDKQNVVPCEQPWNLIPLQFVVRQVLH